MARKLKVIIILLVCFSAVALYAYAAQSPGSPPPVLSAGPGQPLPAVSQGMMPGQMPDIHDIRGPEQVGVNPAIYYWTGGGILTAVILTALALLIRRMRGRQKNMAGEVAATVYERPDEEALRLLAELEKNGAVSPTEFFFMLSAVFRLYIKRRFGIDAPEMTTEELLPEIRRLDMGRNAASGVKEFLIFSDAVKFAKAACEKDRMKRYLDFVRELVKTTSVPAPSPAASEG